MPVNDEFGLGDDDLKAVIESKAAAEQKARTAEPDTVAPKKRPKPVKKAKIADEQEIDFDETLSDTQKLPPTKQPLVRIMIDEVQGMSNYETVSPNGKVYKIKRGVPVYVPQEVVNALELCVMTHIEERKNPVTGEREEAKKHYSAIPWRRM